MKCSKVKRCRSCEGSFKICYPNDSYCSLCREKVAAYAIEHGSAERAAEKFKVFIVSVRIWIKQFGRFEEYMTRPCKRCGEPFKISTPRDNHCPSCKEEAVAYAVKHRSLKKAAEKLNKRQPDFFKWIKQVGRHDEYITRSCQCCGEPFKVSTIEKNCNTCKEEAVAFAIEHRSLKKTAEKFKTSRNTVLNWIKQFGRYDEYRSRPCGYCERPFKSKRQNETHCQPCKADAVDFAIEHRSARKAAVLYNTALPNLKRWIKKSVRFDEYMAR